MSQFSQRSLSSGPATRGTRMGGKKVLALILAGGKGSRLGALTTHRAKPALTFGGTYRLIDFALSNCVHSGLNDVWVIEEYELHSLNDHLGGGRPWDLDRTHGGLQVLPPYRSTDERRGGFASGNAEAIHLHAELIREYAPDVLLVLSADHIYTLDYGPVIACHLETGAAVTMVTTPLPPGEDATRFGNVTALKSGRVKRFEYKPARPTGDHVTTEVFVYDAPRLLDTLKRLAAEKEKKAGQDDPHGGRLGDFGHELLPALVESGDAYAYPFDGYWLDVGLPQAYWQAHQDLLRGTSVTLDDPEWPVLSSSVPRMPARLDAGAEVDASLISYGCHVRGQVRRSVLSPGVIVEPGAVVEDSVLLRDVVVRAGAHVRRAVVDEESDVAGRVSGGPDSVAVVPRRSRVKAGEHLRGALEPAPDQVSRTPPGTPEGRKAKRTPARKEKKGKAQKKGE